MADAQGLVDYIWKSPTPFHCVEETVKRLQAASFSPLDPTTEPSVLRAGQCGYLAQSGTVIAWKMGIESPASAGFRLVGAHTGSPNLRLKPNV